MGTVSTAASVVIGILLAITGFFVLLFAILLGEISGALGGFFLVFALLFLAGGVLLIAQAQQKPSAAPPSPPVTSPQPPVMLPSGTTTKVLQPGTIAITPPGGGTITVTAWLQAPGGALPIVSLPQTFGRDDFRNLVPSHLLSAISKRHFTIGFDYVSRQFVIWDEGSTNGTYVNGVDIRGRGPVPLKYGDIIAPANVIQLKLAASAV